jgi:hydrogenase/urease accessory protein HupE
MVFFVRKWIGLIVILLGVFSSTLHAHESRPVFVQINETSINQFAVQWKIPTSIPNFALPEVIFPDHCSVKGEPVLAQRPDAYLGQKNYICEKALSGQAISIRYPIINPSVSSLIRLKLLNGEVHSHILKPGEERWAIPEAESTLGVAKDYTYLGIQHIWEGIDHLLFVACLIFIARTARRILITITGFTLAHSLTLALSTLQIVELPIPPVEAAIALSIVFLAVEIARSDPSSWTYRFPITVSTSFGLLHGFGFAAVLREIGLPQTELPTALLFFNVGVEIGQIVFVLGLAGLFILGKRFLSEFKRAEKILMTVPVQTMASYFIGAVSSFWLIERINKFWS